MKLNLLRPNPGSWKFVALGCLIVGIGSIQAIPKSHAKDLIAREALIEDSRQMAHLIETVHPEPYLNGGGRMAFHRRMQDILSSIPKNGMSVQDFRALLSPLPASIGDGHTHIYPDEKTDFTGVPLYFLVVERDLYVAGVFDEAYRPLLGARLQAIEGVPVDELIARTRRYYGADNIYGTLAQLANFELFLAKRRIVEDLVPEWTNPGEIRVSLRLPDGAITETVFESRSREGQPLVYNSSPVDLPPLNGQEFSWGFLDGSTDIALLRVRKMMVNRETFEKRSTWSDVSDEAREAWSGLNEGEPPGTTAQVIEALPSLTATYAEWCER